MQELLYKKSILKSITFISGLIMFFLLNYIMIVKSDNMKYVLIFFLNIVFIIGAFFGFDYIIEDYKQRKKSIYLLIIVAFFYSISIISFNYFTINLFTKNTNKYNVRELEDIIKANNLSMQTLSKNISSLNSELNKYNNLENKNELDMFRDKVLILTSQKDKLSSLLEQRKSEYTSLFNKYSNLEKQTVFKIADFPTVSQFPNYPNGCEIAALYLLLKYYNVNVNLEDLANQLDKGPAPYQLNGILYGADPEYRFVGDPRKTNGQGYGVFQKPIAKLANQYKKGIIDYTGYDLDSILKIVGSGKPVQVWASINLKETSICQSWTDIVSGQKVYWRCNLHSMVLIGYTFDDVIVSDPYTGKIRLFSKQTFEKIYDNYGRRALYYE